MSLWIVWSVISKMEILRSFPTVSVNPTVLYACCQCAYYPTTETELTWDIVWNSVTRQLCCVEQNIVYVLPVPPSATYDDVFRALGVNGILSIVWSYHLQDKDERVFRKTQVQHSTMTHVRVFATQAIQEAWSERLAITETIVSTNHQTLL